MAGPTVRRLQLGAELRKLRDVAGYKRKQAADAIGCSESRIVAIELGRNVVSKAELIVLVRDHYNAPDRLATLEELRQEAAKRGWWSTYGLPEWLVGYVGLETDATSVRTFETQLIPGLLQSESYMRRLYTLRGTRLSAKEADRRIGVRLQRQERLDAKRPLQLQAVVSQAVLEHCVGDPEVGEVQLALLLERAGLPNVDLRVLPFNVGLHVGMYGAFSLLSFPDNLLPDAAYQEYAVGGHVIDDESAVSQLDTLFSELRSQSLGTDQSLALIAQLAENTRE